MRYFEIVAESMDQNRDRQLYDELVAAAHAFGSPVENDNGRPFYPEFERVSMSIYKIRFAAHGKAGEFMKSAQASAIVERAGWFISVLRDRSEQRGLNPDKSPRMRHFVEVRLEDVEHGEEVYSPPAILYHVTPASNVPSILQHGLEPRGPTRPEMHRYPPRIHFATSPDAAERIQRILTKHDIGNGVTRPYATVRVDSTAVKPLYVDPEFHSDGVYTINPVPAAAIFDR